ncbi:MAG: hypothetical protein KF891_14270 [Rhizobacter sp.]|nr:hypothetical protein [Rhizobacter sp.]
MKRLRFARPSPTTLLSLAAVLALLALAALLPGCGGVDSGGTGQTVKATSSGRVSGFGSVIVNGVRFDDSQATVTDDEGVPHTRADLKLGMVVEIEGEVQGSSGNGVAERIQFGHEIAGPVEAVDTVNARLVVLGQTVQVDADTLFGGYPAGLADVVAGQLVEVFAFYDTDTGVYTATRIERETALTEYALRGRISGLDAGGKTFLIGAAQIDYHGIAPPALPALANGLSVRVTLATVPVAGRWVASVVHTSQRNFPEAQEAELEGFVSHYASSASFTVAGVPVDASGPDVSVRHGSLDNLADGVRVEVTGQMRSGVLVARVLDFKRGGQQEFELHGAVESVDTAAQTFVLRGVTIAWDNHTHFTGGGRVGDLVVGAQVEAKGAPVGGVNILAKSIKFER